MTTNLRTIRAYLGATGYDPSAFDLRGLDPLEREIHRLEWSQQVLAGLDRLVMLLGEERSDDEVDAEIILHGVQWDLHNGSFI